MKVSVLMPTYNHSKFIRQAIDSFLVQECDFEIELLIGDDFSSDNTAEIAQSYAAKYPDKIRFWRYEKNGGLMKSYKFLISQAKGEYLAILESDDVWIDPLKLSKQVAIIEQTPNCGMVYSNWVYIDKDAKEIKRSSSPKQVATFESLLEGNTIAAVSVLFRVSEFDTYCNIDDYIALGFKTFDYPTWLSLCANNKAIFIKDYTCSYRILSSSISNNYEYKKALAFNENIDQIVTYITNKFGTGYLTLKELYNSTQLRHIITAMEYGELKRAKAMCGSIKVVDLKSALIKFVPTLWITKNRHLINKKNNR